MMVKREDILTNAQQDVLASAEVMFNQITEMCKDLQVIAEAAYVKLPHTNERGIGVQNWCNNKMRAIQDATKSIQNTITWFS